jgi:hypothetical protein
MFNSFIATFWQHTGMIVVTGCYCYSQGHFVCSNVVQPPTATDSLFQSPVSCIPL